MPVMNELLWVLFLTGFGACFGYSLRDHIANKENKAFCDRLNDVLTDEDYRPLPMAHYDELARRHTDG
eukprot:COSAG01_NODE_6702_length_3546_cov_3.445899_4_plen_68_part_00